MNGYVEQYNYVTKYNRVTLETVKITITSKQMWGKAMGSGDLNLFVYIQSYIRQDKVRVDRATLPVATPNWSSLSKNTSRPSRRLYHWLRK